MRYLAHGECLSHRPCKDCDLRFFSTIRQRTFLEHCYLVSRGAVKLLCIITLIKKYGFISYTFSWCVMSLFDFGNTLS